jgi:hypothetical protein
MSLLRRGILDTFCESEGLYLRRVELSDCWLLARWKDDPFVRRMSTGLDTVITPEREARDIQNSLERGHVYLRRSVLTSTNSSTFKTALREGTYIA